MKTPLPLVSVIVPVHDSAPYLAACLQSILSQTHSRLELIVVDDASVDASPEILCRLADADSRIRLFSTGPVALGPAAARNLGMKHIRGEYFLFMDSDDLLYPRAVETLFAVLRQYPEAQFATAPWQSFSGPDPDLPSALPNVSPNIMSGQRAALTMLYQSGNRQGITVSPCIKLFRTPLADALRFPDGMLYEDLGSLAPFTSTLPAIACVAAPLMAYRLHDTSILGHFTPRRLDVLLITMRLRRAFRNNPALQKAADTRSFAAAFNILLHLTALPSDHLHADLEYVKPRLFRLLRLLRRRVLTARRARLRDRLGAFSAYCPGPRLLAAILRRYPRLLGRLTAR